MLEGTTTIEQFHFRRIPPGEYLMGSKEKKRDSPIVKVTISSAFNMLEAPVTRGQWRRAMGSAPWESHGLSSTSGDENIPATWIGFAEARTFCERFKQGFGANAFLPSEAQWEYAYRAGTHAKWFWGDDRTKAPLYAVFATEHERGELCSTRTRKPNDWHLYDMAGLVYEWVYGEYEQDTLTPYVKLGTYPSEAVDFVARGNGMGHMIRGGSYLSGPGGGTATAKALRNPDAACKDIGFRICIPANGGLGR